MKNRKKIWANTIVNNEENFIWFAVMSVIDYVDKVLIYDTGSLDNTPKIVEEIIKMKGDKVEFKKVGNVDKFQFTNLRQRMLEESKCDWIITLDGDEVWWEDSIKKLTDEIHEKGDSIESIVVPVVVPVGDIYHLQEEKAGQYQLLGRKGHLNLRAISKKIPGLHLDLPHPQEGYFDLDNHLIHKRDGAIFLNTPYMHMTHLKRSQAVRSYNKFKLELGDKPSSSFRYPEVLYKPYPKVVPSPWTKMSLKSKVLAGLLTPLRKIKRRIR